MVESSSSNGLACAMHPRIHRAYLEVSLMILGAGLISRPARWPAPLRIDPAIP